MAVEQDLAKVNTKSDEPKFELIAPDGGWGYAVMLSIILVFGMAIIPMGGFGIVYAPFLSKIGDVTSGTAIANSIFNTCLCFTGLAANQLLQKLSYRKVGLIGALVYFTGSFGIIFVNSLFQLILTFGVLQGIGFGLLMPCVFTAFNDYFKERRNFVMSIAQAILGIEAILVPIAFQYLMEEYGFRGTVALMSAFSLNAIPAAISLQPIKWHLKKRKLSDAEINKEQQKIQIENKPLLELSEKHHRLEKKDLHNSSRSIVSIGHLAMSTQSVHKLGKGETFWTALIKALDLGLFKDPVYVNIIVGIALSITSDLAFLSVYPLLLVGSGFNASELAFIMTTYFIADLVSRIFLTVLTGMVSVKNRYLFLLSVLVSAIFRIAFVMDNSFWWVTSISAILGFMRCSIQVLLPLVIAEAYEDRFVTAFSLYMVVCGFVALSVGFLAATIKDYTKSDIMVVHLLSVIYLLCGIPWTIEILYVKFFKKREPASK